MTIQRFHLIPGVAEVIETAQHELKKITGVDLLLHVIEANFLADALVKKCCEIWEVEFTQLRKISKLPNEVVMREILVLILFRKTELKKSEITKYMGYKNHASFWRMNERIESQLFRKDNLFMKYYEPVKHLIHESTEV